MNIAKYNEMSVEYIIKELDKIYKENYKKPNKSYPPYELVIKSVKRFSNNKYKEDLLYAINDFINYNSNTKEHEIHQQNVVVNYLIIMVTFIAVLDEDPWLNFVFIIGLLLIFIMQIRNSLKLKKQIRTACFYKMVYEILSQEQKHHNPRVKEEKYIKRKVY